MKKSFRLVLVSAALTAFANPVLAQEAQPTPAPATDSPIAGTLPGNTFGIDIPPQTFPPRAQDDNPWDLNRNPYEGPRIEVPPPREVERGAINIGPLTVRESDASRRTAGCRWTVRRSTLSRACRF